MVVRFKHKRGKTAAGYGAPGSFLRAPPILVSCESALVSTEIACALDECDNAVIDYVKRGET